MRGEPAHIEHDARTIRSSTYSSSTSTYKNRSCRYLAAFGKVSRTWDKRVRLPAPKHTEDADDGS